MMSALGFKAWVDFFLACFLACVILRFTSGTTLADCVEINIAVKPFQLTYLQIMCPQELVGFEPMTMCATAQYC